MKQLGCSEKSKWSTAILKIPHLIGKLPPPAVIPFKFFTKASHQRKAKRKNQNTINHQKATRAPKRFHEWKQPTSFPLMIGPAPPVMALSLCIKKGRIHLHAAEELLMNRAPLPEAARNGALIKSLLVFRRFHYLKFIMGKSSSWTGERGPKKCGACWSLVGPWWNLGSRAAEVSINFLYAIIKYLQ